MARIWKQFVVALVAAIIGGIVSYLGIVGGWFTDVIAAQLRREISKIVIKQLEFEITQSQKVREKASAECLGESKLVAASCVGFSPDAQVAVGPVFKTERRFECYRYGNTPMDVQATAVCFKVK